MEKKKTVSLGMIVKNEERFLRKCLESVQDLVDEIIIVDTGSEDKTIEIAESFNAKIYHYEWDNNFANARNVYVENATKDWILVLDGDDIFEREDIEKFIEVVNTSEKDGHYFKTLSLINENDKKNFSYNLNLRLLRNNGKYKYNGAIHEQVISKEGVTDYSKFINEDIRIYHLGYIQSVIDEKQKRQRNMTLINEELKKDPFNPFQNFNMAVEYYAMSDLENSLKHFNTAYNVMNPSEGYGNKLILRRIMLLFDMKKYEEAIKGIEEGIGFFPDFTDLYFYKALTLGKQKKYTLAIKEYEKCISMGEAPIHLRFINGASTFRAYYELGNIYFKLKDYDEAIKNFEKCLESNKENWGQYFNIAKCYDKALGKEKTIDKLKEILDVTDVNDMTIFIIIITELKYYEEALQYSLEQNQRVATDILIDVLSKILIYLDKPERAYYQLIRMPKESPYFNDSKAYIILIKMITNKLILDEDFEVISDENKKEAIKLIYDLYVGNEVDKEFDEPILKEVINLLQILIRANKFEMFEKAVPSLNYINSKNCLLELAKLYERNGYTPMALEEIIRSLKEFDKLDEESIDILYFNI